MAPLLEASLNTLREDVVYVGWCPRAFPETAPQVRDGRRGHPRKDPLITASTVDSSLFSHPVTEEPRPEARTAPQDDRYGNLFRQPEYTPEPVEPRRAR